MHWPFQDKLYLRPIRLETFSLRKHGPALLLLEAASAGECGIVRGHTKVMWPVAGTAYDGIPGRFRNRVRW